MKKRFNFMFLSVFCLLMAGLGTSLRAEFLTMDPTGGAMKVVPGTKEIVIQSEVPEVGGMGWKFVWDAEKSSYVEHVFQKNMAPKRFAAAVVRAKFWCPLGCPALSICVRFRDAEGEILQFQKRVSFSKGGVFDVEWPIALNGAEGSWGCEKLNRVIDQPAQLHAMTVSYRADFSTGFLYLLDLTMETMELPETAVENVSETAPASAAPVMALRPLCQMNDSSKFRKLWGTADYTLENGQLNFEIQSSQVGVLERKFEIQRFETKPTELVFETELLNGSASLEAAFCYADRAEATAHKEVFKTVRVPIPEGQGRTVLDLSETLKDAEFPVRLQWFNIVKTSEETVSLGIRGILAAERQLAAAAVDFEVVTPSPIHVLNANETGPLAFRFINRGDRAGNFQFKMEFENYFGDKRNETLQASLAAGEAKDLVPQWRPDSLGHWDVRATVICEAQPNLPVTKSRSLAWIKPSGPTKGRTDDFLFSVCTHTERWSDGDQRREIETAALCGVKVVRLGGGWCMLEPEKGVWNWEGTDRLVDLYAEAGIEPQMILGTTPDWAVPQEIRDDPQKINWKNFPENLEDWKNYVREVGKHFKGRIRYYEIWNEPDLTGFSEMTLEQYATLQKAAFEAMAEVDPEAMIMSGGFATLARHSSLIYPEFQHDFLLAAKGAFRIHAIHEHGWFDGYRNRIDGLFLPLREATGTTVPWYSNETAMTSVGGNEHRQAQTLFKKLLFAWVRGSIGYTWYDLRNDGFDPRYGEHHFGMVTNDFYPKSVFSVYNMLTANYSSMKTAEDCSPDPIACVYKFSDGKTILFAGWAESTLEETRHFIFQTDATSAKLVDLMGNEKPVGIQDSLLVLELGADPQTLKLEGGTHAEPIGELIHAEAMEELVPTRRQTLPLAFFNPLNRDVEFEFSVPYGITGLSFDSSIRTVSLPTLGKTISQIEVDVTPAFRRSSVLPILWKLKGTDWSGILYVPLKPAFWASSTLPDTEDPTASESAFLLNRQNQITPLTPADPFNTHRLWTGPQDLSARVWVAGNTQELRIRAEVEDDQEMLAKEESDLEAQKGSGDQLRVLLQSKSESESNSELNSELNSTSESESEKRTVELCVARLASGKTIACVRVNGVETRRLEATSVKILRSDSRVLYEISIPWELLGFSAERLSEDGVHLDVLIGDDDGEGLDSWLHATNIHPDARTLRQSPCFLFEK